MAQIKVAHAALDAAVLRAYGFSSKRDLLKQLLDLNLAVARRIERGQPVVGPGIPLGFKPTHSLVSDDCIRPDPLPIPAKRPPARRKPK